MSKTQIEKEYQNLVKNYNYHCGKKTGNEAVLQYLRENTTSKKCWFWAWEVVGKKTKTGDWLSHRAPARLSELSDKGVLESRRVGKYVVYRILNHKTFTGTLNEKNIHSVLNQMKKFYK